LPSHERFALGGEGDLGRIPIAGHEGIEVVAVPGGVLEETTAPKRMASEMRKAFGMAGSIPEKENVKYAVIRI
jgi:hypothetical protein